MKQINIDKEWDFVVREMKHVPRQFPPKVVFCRELLLALRALLSAPNNASDYSFLKKYYQQHKKSLRQFY